MNTLWRDIRFALRGFTVNRGFTAAVAISIALGIAANTTVFTIVNALLLGDMPVPEPDRVVAFSGGRTFSWPDYRDYREQTKSVFEDVSAHFVLVPASVGGSGEPERVWGQLADAAFFSTIGAPVRFGRGILASEDEKPGESPVVVLSDALWHRRFGADPAVVGRSIVLNNSQYTVVGVTAPGFHGMIRGFTSEFWVPLAMADQIMPDLHTAEMKGQRHAQWVELLARLRPGVTREQATAAVNTVKQRLESEYRKGQKPRPPITLSSSVTFPGIENGAMGAAAVLMAVTGLVLLIACVNVAGLLLARATVRAREIGIRMAIGAGRGRIIRQLLTESVLLSLAGAAGGFLLAYAATRAIAGFDLPLPIPIGFEFRMDLRVVFFTAALAIATGVLFGLAPAIRATRPNLVGALKNETPQLAGVRRFGMRNLLVLAQVALSLVLLVSAGLFVRSLQKASSIDLGMRTGGITMMAVDPKLHHYSPERTRQFVSELRASVSALPGVQSVTFADSLPLSLGGTSFGFRTPGAKDEVTADVYRVGAGYFSTLGIPLRRGRDFDLGRDTGRTVILNEEAARQLFPNLDALGRQIEADSSPGNPKQLYDVIGVVKNSKSRTLAENTAASAYFFLEPKPEDAFSFYGISVLVRGGGPSGPMQVALRNRIHALDPNLAIFNAETMAEHVDKSLLIPRLCATLLGIFGIVGVMLATVGLYGVMSFTARARTREIGIRMALGAQPGSVLRMITAQGIVLVGIGLAAGLAASLALTRFVASLLYGVSPTDALTFVGVPLVMVAVAAVAVLIPARRAARVDPLQALRCD